MKRSGFSLIELLLVIVIIAIMVSVVSPSFIKFNQDRQLSASRDLLKSGLAQAFSLARSQSAYHELVLTTGDHFASIYACSDVHCTNRTLVERVDFLSPNILPDQDLMLRFTAPFGDLDSSAFGADDTLEIWLQNQMPNSLGLKIYKQSGLVESL